MQSRVTNCLICDQPLSYHQAKTDKLCGKLKCKWKHATLLPHQACSQCGRPLAASELAGRVCLDVNCQRARREELVVQIARQKLEALQVRGRALRERVAPTVGLSDAEAYPVAIIPANVAAIVHVPERRRRAFRDQLTRLLHEATMRPRLPTPEARLSETASDSTATMSPEFTVVMSKSCGCCRGHCCQKGGNHAFLTTATLRRYLATHPGARPRDVLATYLAHVGNKAYERSCVYHGLTGCTLPRDLRSDTCNDYFCRELKAYHKEQAAVGPARGFFVAVQADILQNAAFIDEKELRIVSTRR